jgi:Mg/Co/Ni transporter MgtE
MRRKVPVLDPVTKGYLSVCPTAAARTLLRLESGDIQALFEAMPGAVAASILEHMASASAARCLADLPKKVITEILEDMRAPAAVAVLRHMKHDQVKRLLDSLPRTLSLRLRIGLRFSETVVGAYVDAHVITLKPEHHVNDALRLYRQEGRQTGYTIYVVDDNRHLVGEVHLNDLLGARDRTLVSRIMQPAAAVLNSRMALHSVANDVAWLTNDSLPVVNRNNVFQGVLWRDRVIDKEQKLINNVSQHGELASTRAALADILWMVVGSLFMGSKHAADSSKVED